MYTPRLNLFELILGLSEAIDLVSPAVANHHKRVAYIAAAIAEKLGLPENIQRQLILAGAVHDIGGFTIKERVISLQFEDEFAYEHAEIGYSLINIYEPLQPVAEIVRFHHVPWHAGQGQTFKGLKVPKESHILHLADRIAVLVDNPHTVLEKAAPICERIAKSKDILFVPEYVDAFLELAKYEYFWLDIVSNCLDHILSRKFAGITLNLDLDDLVDISRIFSRIVDFRSPVNAAHSSGVANSAKLLSDALGFSKDKSILMLVAGYLHDIGKLAVPPEILEKPGKLTPEEFMIIKRHTYYTNSILSNIKTFEEITKWAAYHHEKLDGTGYPFHLTEKDLPLESQVMSVADVFTAITEDRPYRPGMGKPEVINVLNRMVQNRALNGDIVKVLINNYDVINQGRSLAQQASLEEYGRFLTPLSKLLK